MDTRILDWSLFLGRKGVALNYDILQTMLVPILCSDIICHICNVIRIH
jgi:hypothetical protein